MWRFDARRRTTSSISYHHCCYFRPQLHPSFCDNHVNAVSASSWSCVKTDQVETKRATVVDVVMNATQDKRVARQIDRWVIPDDCVWTVTEGIWNLTQCGAALTSAMWRCGTRLLSNRQVKHTPRSLHGRRAPRSQETPWTVGLSPSILKQTVWPPGSADTVCSRPSVTLTFDRLTSKLVWSHLRWGTFFPNLGTLGLCILELFAMYATDEQTDGRTYGRTDKSNANCPLSYGRGITIYFGVFLVFAARCCADFQNSFIYEKKQISNETRILLPPYLQYVAALPCES